MRLFIKTVREEQGENKTFIEIPNSTVAGGAIILAIIQALATLLGSYLSNIPKQQSDKVLNQLKEKNFTVQVLQRVLENPDTLDRSNSLKLLISAGVLQDPENKILEITKIPANVPRWEKHPLEPINGNNELDLKQNQVSPNNKTTVIDTVKMQPF